MFLELYEFILKFIWKSDQTIVAKETLRCGGLPLPDIKIHYKTSVIKPHDIDA